MARVAERSIIAALVNKLPSSCNVFTSDQRVRAHETRCVYADVVVVCGAPEIAHDDVITNPMIIVEVLSQSTEQYDRGLKCEAGVTIDVDATFAGAMQLKGD